MTLKNKPILYYDSQCKLCTKTKSLVFRFDPKDVNFLPLTPKKIQQFQKQLLITQHLSQNVMYYQNKQGKIFIGSHAFFEYLKDKKGFFYVLGMLGDFPLIKWFAKIFYTSIAENRYVISHLL